MLEIVALNYEYTLLPSGGKDKITPQTMERLREAYGEGYIRKSLVC